ncbi:succinate dehydrogenase/fumarate reductase iron-sulfur subunit [Spirosoma utsteinense]|uniref:Succinate dehydrogenase / fumarate reductase iron-sulfur subunit n=1 Tax=Spirosoma utsteinense TaxID=2585773 RepID=A0ABR6WD19_9BACT|nr:succinate dehydrogenase/fumarate reductase iron-sulfur subunit [Spirosoma utsteinense]MBC3787487.1 succinate dehydrogenase / fumarate reductase iron-sulfur subunit [Spirosoma utsteinense]MBC3794424.1 succinate dehydrogenase / fumarate reductase iron-sulfur subunit [Spirosoma utsteinense]
MDFTLKVWRQKNAGSRGKLVEYKLSGISPSQSFLEMVDVLNGELTKRGEEIIAFDHDCREGICGSCAMFINGRPHGPQTGGATCILHMRSFNDGDTIVIEPWRARGFPVIKDLVTDRTAFDRIVQAGGYISVNTGSAPDANEIPISREVQESAMDAAACIACGACVAACKNASAMLFVGAMVSRFALLPQGQLERKTRAERMVAQMDSEGFGACSFIGACSIECPASISVDSIARLNREYLGAKLTQPDDGS